MPIDPLSLAAARSAAPGGMSAPPGEVAGSQSFRDFLEQSIVEVNRLQQVAEAASDSLAAGRTDNLAEVYSAVAQSKVAFDLMLEVRNKLIDAYNEVLRMRV